MGKGQKFLQGVIKKRIAIRRESSVPESVWNELWRELERTGEVKRGLYEPAAWKLNAVDSRKKSCQEAARDSEKEFGLVIVAGRQLKSYESLRSEVSQTFLTQCSRTPAESNDSHNPKRPSLPP